MNASASNSTFGSVAARYRALPRAMRWLVWLAAGLVLYFAVIEPVMITLATYHDRARAAMKNIETFGTPDQADLAAIRDGRKRWGDVLPPTIDQGRVLQAKTAIAAVLSRHNLTRDVALTERSISKLKTTEESRTGVEYWRAPIEVKFSAAPHVAMAVIAELEMIPSVAQIASIRIRRHTDRAEVEVTLVADAWYIKQG